MKKVAIIKKLKSGKYRIYSKKKDKSGKRRNLGTFDTLSKAKEHERQIQYFKHNSDDGVFCEEDDRTKIINVFCDIAQYLHDNKFFDLSDKMYVLINLSEEDSDNNFDGQTIPDAQSNVDMISGIYDGSIGSMPSFSMDQARVAVDLANSLDGSGFYKYANRVDDFILKIINNLEKIINKRKLNYSEKKKEILDEQDVVARSNGLVGSSVVDNQNSGMFSGFSDAYFYSSYGNAN